MAKLRHQLLHPRQRAAIDLAVLLFAGGHAAARNPGGRHHQHYLHAVRRAAKGELQPDDARGHALVHLQSKGDFRLHDGGGKLLGVCISFVTLP